jgi:hypothetical protein
MKSIILYPVHLDWIYHCANMVRSDFHVKYASPCMCYKCFCHSLINILCMWPLMPLSYFRFSIFRNVSSQIRYFLWSIKSDAGLVQLCTSCTKSSDSYYGSEGVVVFNYLIVVTYAGLNNIWINLHVVPSEVLTLEGNLPASGSRLPSAKFSILLMLRTSEFIFFLHSF